MSNSLNTALPETLTFSVIYDGGTEPDSSYFDATIYDVVGDSVFDGSVFDAYCIDADRVIGLGNSRRFVGQVYSSYETLPANFTQGTYLENPQNLDLVNWIINQGFIGKTSSDNGKVFSSSDVQIAIWTLLDDNIGTGGLGREGGAWTQARVDEIVQLAQANGEGFVPSYEYTTYFGEQVTGKLGMIILPRVDSEGLPTKQTIIRSY